ncbi:MAG: hypothetical protein J6B77_01615 [Clostridia bacterium]|nr:hypothetical protein [Clostridia bacterium]
MKHTLPKRVIGLFLGVCLLCGLLTGLSSCRTGEVIAPETAITSVELNQSGDRLSISATLSSDDASRYQNGTLCLFALELFQTVTMVENGGVKPVAESRGAESMHFAVDFHFENGTRNRLTQRFLLASRDENGIYHAITEAVYIANPESLAEGSVVATEDTLKGVAIVPSDDVTMLAPSHTVIDIAIEEYLQSVPKKGDSISFLYAGETLSLSESAVIALDEQVRSLLAHGSKVYLRPVLTTAPDDLGALSSIGYDGSPETSAYALNIENEIGYFYIAGFFSFLAQRYPAVSGVIPGAALNDAAYNGSTVTTMEQYVSNTLAIMRLAHNIFNATTAGIRVYLPVSNLFTTDGTLGATECGTRDFLATFAAYAKRSGDFNWSIYLTMKTPVAETDALYSENGTVNTDGVTEKYLYPQTVNQLLELLTTDALLYGGAQRDMIWSVSLSGKGEGGMEHQRLSLLYAYMKAIAQNTAPKSARVRAVIWETLEDSESYAGGLIAADGTLKPAGELFLLLGRRDLATEIDLAGAEAKLGTRYAEIEDVISTHSEGKKVYLGTIATTASIPENSRSTLLFGEGAGYGNAFSSLPGTGVVSIRRQHYDQSPILTATFDDAVGCGVYTSALSSAQLKGRNLLSVTVAAALPAGYTNVPLRLIIEENGAGKEIHSYTAEGIVTDGTWATIVFDIKEFASDLHSDTGLTLTLSLSDTGASAETPLTLYLSKVELYESQNWFVRGGWVLILVILILVALTIALVWFFQTYEVRFTSGDHSRSARGGKKHKGGNSLKQKLRRWFAGVIDRMQIRPKSHSRIMVKPGSMPSGDPLSGRGFDGDDEEALDGDDDFEDTTYDDADTPRTATTNTASAKDDDGN